MFLFAILFEIKEDHYYQREEEENLRGESLCDILSSDQHVLFLVALLISALNTSAVRNSLRNLATQKTTLLGTDEEVIKASLFLAFFVCAYPLYKLILYLKASTLVQTFLLLSAYSCLLFGPSNFFQISASPTVVMAGEVL